MGLIYYPLLKRSWACSKSHWSEREFSVDFNGLCIRPTVSDSTQNFRACFLYNARAKKTVLTLETTGSLHILLHSLAICIHRVHTADGCVNAPRGINWRREREKSKSGVTEGTAPIHLHKDSEEQQTTDPEAFLTSRSTHLTLPMFFQNRIKYHLQWETCVSFLLSYPPTFHSLIKSFVKNLNYMDGGEITWQTRLISCLIFC